MKEFDPLGGGVAGKTKITHVFKNRIVTFDVTFTVPFLRDEWLFDMDHFVILMWRSTWFKSIF